MGVRETVNQASARGKVRAEKLLSLALCGGAKSSTQKSAETHFLETEKSATGVRSVFLWPISGRPPHMTVRLQYS